MSHSLTSVAIDFANPLIHPEVAFWHDDEGKILYIIVDGLISEECLRTEMDFFENSYRLNFMTGEFAILCQFRKSAVISPEAFSMVETFVTGTLNTRYLPTGVALVADESVDEYLALLPRIKQFFDSDVTPFRSFYGFLEAENWLLQLLQKKR